MSARKESVEDFDDWYEGSRSIDRHGCLEFRVLAPCATELWSKFEDFKREHRSRVENYYKYEIMADAEVVSTKPDLPNVSSGEIAGMVRRIARNVVQHTPNVEVICEFDDDSPKGILARHILKTKIIGDDLRSNEMQQNLFASVMTSFTLGFDAVVPSLQQKGDGTWCIDYDTIHYQDIFPEPGVKDARRAPEVFVRRYLTKGEVKMLIRTAPSGWDIPALKKLVSGSVPPIQRESVPHQERKHRRNPDGYEVITWYNSYGDKFLTFDANSKMLLRIEKNKHPHHAHPVQMLVLEKDPLQPLGKSQVALVFGRQEFQDLMLNGAMKLWYKNINPTIIGYGTGLQGVPNMSPGKYTNIPNPNAKIEVFETNTQTLLQYGTISQQNMGSMVNLVGAADQQMAATAGSGMSQTPQGVEAQQQMVDITTNNYQKAVENFFSSYCSYALTMYFAELNSSSKITPSADARRELLNAGVEPELFDLDGKLNITMKDMAVPYSVRCVPGSLVEMEDEKQLRILNELFVPLSQAMPALAASQDPEVLANAAAAMQFIVQKEIQLSGSAHSEELALLLKEGPTGENQRQSEKIGNLETGMGQLAASLSSNNEQQSQLITQLGEQVKLLAEAQGLLLEKLGVTSPASTPVEATPAAPVQGLPAA